MKKLLNLKRLLKARNSSGFTLVEVILSCALLSILILGIMMFVTPVLRMVTSGQKNARATMLSETMDTYIAGVLRTAKRVEVFENVNYVKSDGTDIALSGLSADAAAGIQRIRDFMTPENSTKYEVRALAIVCKDDGDITTQGLRVYNAQVDQSSLNVLGSSISPENQALNDLMFTGLCATVKIDNFETQDPSTGDPTGVNASGFKITTKVYSDTKCYGFTQETRDKSILVFEGVTFFENMNMRQGDGIPGGGSVPAEKVIEVDSVQGVMDACTEVPGQLLYPATIIYYVSPKK